MERRVLALLLATGCGRIGFGAIESSTASDAPGGEDSPGAVDGHAPAVLEAYYAFDTAAGPSIPDSSGHMQNATCQSTSCPTLAPGRTGMGYSFDGADDRVLVPDNGYLDFLAGFSIALWLRPNPGSCRTAISKPKASGAGASWQLIVLANDTWFCTVDAAAVEHCLATGVALPDATWSHVALVWDGQTKHIFIDGADAASEPGTTTFDNTAMLVGADRENGNFLCYFGGTIDELRIFAGALDANEVAALARP
jgi:hypothetical protein